MFVAASIQFKSLGAQGKLRSHGVGRLHSGITVLKILKEIWKPLQPIVSPPNRRSGISNFLIKWSSLDALFRSGRVDINRLTRSDPDAPDLSPDFDQITSHRILPVDAGGSANFYSFVEDQVHQGRPQRSASVPKPAQNLRGGSTSFAPKERQSKQLQQTPPRQQSANAVSMPNPSYQQYGQPQANINYQPLPPNMQQGALGGSASPEVITFKRELAVSIPPPRNINVPSYIAQPAPISEVVGGFSVPMAGLTDSLEDGTTNMWWNHPYNMELDSYDYAITGEEQEYYSPRGV